MHLGGKTVLITGASEGIGKELARLLAKKGCRLLLVARTAEKLRLVQEELAGPNYVVNISPLDISSPAAVRKVFVRWEKQGKQIDMLINNAAVGLFAEVARSTLEDAHQLFATNFFAPLQLIQYVLPQMRQRQEGLIVNISSAIAQQAPFYQGVYAGSKAALERLSEALRIEEKAQSIRVLTVQIDRTRTNFKEHVLGQKENYRLPFRGHFASPEQVAAKIVTAMERDQTHLYTSWKAALFAKAVGNLPRLVEKMFHHEYSKVVK